MTDKLFFLLFSYTRTRPVHLAIVPPLGPMRPCSARHVHWTRPHPVPSHRFPLTISPTGSLVFPLSSSDFQGPLPATHHFVPLPTLEDIIHQDLHGCGSGVEVHVAFEVGPIPGWLTYSHMCAQNIFSYFPIPKAVHLDVQQVLFLLPTLWLIYYAYTLYTTFHLLPRLGSSLVTVNAELVSITNDPARMHTSQRCTLPVCTLQRSTWTGMLRKRKRMTSLQSPRPQVARCTHRASIPWQGDCYGH